MKKELRYFWTSVMFYTRLPCPNLPDYQSSDLNKASRYFPLIGYIVGGLSALTFLVSATLWTIEIAVLASLLIGVLITGAFHEDGLADACDGFGGGWSKTKILDIMKDSRIGTYGSVALIFLFALKFWVLHSLFSQTILLEQNALVVLLFITYHALARLTAISISFVIPYSREDASSKSKPISQASSWKEVTGAFLFGLLPLLGLVFLVDWKVLLVLLPLLGVFWYAKNYFLKWLDGYTGDCLGAVEQIAECIILLTFSALWKFL